jgi:hypothetical protein
MAIQYRVQYSDSDDATQTINFYDPNDGQGRIYLDSKGSGNVQDNKRFSIPGVDGNFLIRSGFRGLQSELKVRYRGALTDAVAAWKSDREAMAKYSCSIGGPSVFDYTRCTLRSDSAQRITEEMASGATGLVWFDVRYVFDVEEL